MAAWLGRARRLAGAALEVEHRQLVLEPDAALSAIAELLELPDQAAARFREFVMGNRPEKPMRTSVPPILSRISTCKRTRRVMVETCDRLMAAYGYSLSRELFRPL